MVKNLLWLVCNFDLNQSKRKSLQVKASAHKTWPNGVASRPKFSTRVYLWLCLERAWEYIFRQTRSKLYVMHRHSFEIQNALVSKWRMLLSWKVSTSYVPVKSKLKHPPPRQPPRHLNFWKIFVQILPSRGRKAVQMPHHRSIPGDQMPHPGKLFGSFYYAPEHGLRQHSYMPKII